MIFFATELFIYSILYIIMVSDTALLSLRYVAFGENSSPKDRISACSTLIKHGIDFENVVSVLSELCNVENVYVKDKDKVGAATILMRALSDNKTLKEKSDVDKELATEELLSTYVKVK